jgi:hypothetical protein
VRRKHHDVKNMVVLTYGRAKDVTATGGNRWPASREAQHPAATRTNVRRHNSQNVCSYLLNASAVVPLYAEDAARRLEDKPLPADHRC